MGDTELHDPLDDPEYRQAQELVRRALRDGPREAFTVAVVAEQVRINDAALVIAIWELCELRLLPSQQTTAARRPRRRARPMARKRR